jgi:hypothetical protein
MSEKNQVYAFGFFVEYGYWPMLITEETQMLYWEGKLYEDRSSQCIIEDWIGEVDRIFECQKDSSLLGKRFGKAIQQMYEDMPREERLVSGPALNNGINHYLLLLL